MEYSLDNFCFVFNNESSVFKRGILFLNFYYQRRNRLKRTKFFNFIKISQAELSSAKFEVHIRSKFRNNYRRKEEILFDIMNFVSSYKSVEFRFDAYGVDKLLDYYLDKLKEYNLQPSLDIINDNSLYIKTRVKFDSKYPLALIILKLLRRNWLDYSKIIGWKTYTIRIENPNYVR